MSKGDFLEAIEVMKKDVSDNLQEQSVQKGSKILKLFWCSHIQRIAECKNIMVWAKLHQVGNPRIREIEHSSSSLRIQMTVTLPLHDLSIPRKSHVLAVSPPLT